jgi:ABC-type multidrug transport system permease subunit
MFAATCRILWNAIKAGVTAAVIWTCGFSAILWFFSKPSIPYGNFVQILTPYSLAFFGMAALVFEALTQWMAADTMKYERE